MLEKPRMKVMKFGGASLKGADDIREIVSVISSEKDRKVVVLSAINGATDSISSFISNLKVTEKEIEALISSLREVHMSILSEVSHSDKEAKAWIERRCDQLARLLYGVAYTEELTPRTRDLIHSYGERLSVALLASALKAEGIDSKALEADAVGMITDGVFSHASVRFEEATPKLRASLIPLAKRLVPVVTGYFGCDERGRTTTFGRGGSDYTAAVLASSLDASCVELWKDVDGFMSADPRVVKDAHLIKDLSYDEAAELAYFGSKILHPRTVEPLIPKGIPLFIKNTKNPKGAGSVVSGKRHLKEDIVKSVTHTPNIGFLKIHGPGIGYKPGVLMNIVSRLSADDINIKSVLTAQTCINILLDSADTTAGMRSLAGLYETSIANIEQVDGIGLIAVVGEGLIEKKGLGARVFKATADHGINVEMVAAGASRVAMYFLVKEKVMKGAVRAIHAEFFENGIRARYARN